MDYIASRTALVPRHKEQKQCGKASKGVIGAPVEISFNSETDCHQKFRCGGVRCAVSDMTRMYWLLEDLLPNGSISTQEREGRM